MKILVPGILVFLFISILFYSCEYEPNEINEKFVNKIVWTPDIQITGLDINADTIFLYSGKFINFSISCNNKDIQAALLAVDNDEELIEYSATGNFTFPYEELTEGIHSLFVQVYTSSGTGSIADQIGAEGYIASYSWILVVDGSYHPEFTADSQDGFLKLSWTEYPFPDFKEYLIYNTTGAYLGSANSNHDFIDSSYVGEGGFYNIYVRTLSGNLIVWGQPFLKAELPGIFSATTSNNQKILYWNKSKYYNAVDTFELSQSVDDRVQYSRVKATTDPNDTNWRIITTNIVSDVNFKLKLIPKSSNTQFNISNFHLFESQINVDPGFRYNDRFMYAYNLNQVNQDEFIFSSGCDNIIRYSVSQNYAVEKLENITDECYGCGFKGVEVSSSGKFITAYMKCLNDLMLANSDNLNAYAVHSINNLTGDSYAPVIPVSDFGTGIINNIDGGFYLYDFNQSITLTSYKLKQVGLSGLKISQNGDYIFLKDNSLHLVQYKDLQFTTIWDQAEGNQIRFYEFDASNPNQLIILDGSEFSVKRCNDFSDIHAYELKDTYIVDIDYYNREILTYGFESFKIRNLTDGSLTMEIPVDTKLLLPNECHYVNHAIIVPTGNIYFIQ